MNDAEGAGSEASPQITEQVPVTAIHGDLSQQIVKITVDKLHLTLLQHERQLTSSRAWETPLGILAALILALVTTTFRDALFIKAATWNAVFLIGAGLTFVWLVKAVVWRVKAPSVDDLMEKFKKPE